MSKVGQDWYYVDEEGKAVTGEHTINADRVYLKIIVVWLRVTLLRMAIITTEHVGAKTDLGTNRYGPSEWWLYYIGSTGTILKGQQTIDGVEVYFDTTTGKQAKGVFINEYGNAENPNYGLNNC